MPGLLTILSIGLFPLLFTVFASFTDWKLLPPSFAFAGVESYVRIISSREFPNAIRVTLMYVVGGLSIEMLLGLVGALLFRGMSKKSMAIRSLIISPILLAPVVTGMVWKYLFYPGVGPVTNLLLALGLPMISTGSMDTAFLSILIADIWQWTPLILLIFLSGILSIPNELFEAAELDQMSRVARFRYIILPNLPAVTAIIVLLRGTLLFSEFDKIFILTRGGPGTVTSNLVYQAYEAGFGFYSISDAATWSVFILILVNVFVFATMELLRRAGTR